MKESQVNLFFNPLHNSVMAYVLPFSAGLVMISNGVCLGYMYKKLKLNKSIKTILYTIGVHNFIASIIILIGLIKTLVNLEQSYLGCVLILPPIMLAVGCDLISGAIISCLRYCMVLNASKTQILDVNDIKKFCIICYSSFYISQISFYIVSEMEKGLSPLRLCFSDNYSFQGRFPGGQLIVGSYNLGFCVLGIFNDIRPDLCCNCN